LIADATQCGGHFRLLHPLIDEVTGAVIEDCRCDTQCKQQDSGGGQDQLRADGS